MNPISWLWNEIKDDIATIKKIASGEAKTNVDLKELWNSFSLGEVLTENKTFFMIIIMALFTGGFISATYYENQCNVFIEEEGLTKPIAQNQLGQFGPTIKLFNLSSYESSIQNDSSTPIDP